MKSFAEKTLAEIVTDNASAAVLFEQNKLDFCCKGKRTLDDACREGGLDTILVSKELERLETEKFQSDLPDFDAMNTDELIDHIVRMHHSYVTRMLPLIDAHLMKVADKHGKRFPEAVRISELFALIREELTSHMKKEEQVLFPHITKLFSAVRNEVPFIPLVSLLSSPISVMEQEHEIVGKWMAEIRNASSDYTPPENSCMTHRLSYAELSEFEQDLHRHIHLENNILFPKALRLEKLLRAQVQSREKPGEK